MVDGKSLQTLHDEPVVERSPQKRPLSEYPVPTPASNSRFNGSGAGGLLFPFVNFDAGLDAQIVDENRFTVGKAGGKLKGKK